MPGAHKCMYIQVCDMRCQSCFWPLWECCGGEQVCFPPCWEKWEEFYMHAHIPYHALIAWWLYLPPGADFRFQVSGSGEV